MIYDFSSMIGNVLFGWIDKLGVVGKILKGIAGIAIVYAAYQAYGALAGIPIVGPILGGIAAAAVTAAGFGLLNSQKADDMVSPGYGKRTILSPEGSIALNDKDTIIAGTNLGGGGETISPPISSSGGGETISPSIDLTPMIVAINQVKASIDRLYSKDSTIQMGAKTVGTTLSQTSTKLA
jgi:hypothetical protein